VTITSVREAPLAPGGLPVLGHALELKRHPGDLFLSLQAGEPVTRIRMGRQELFVVNPPEVISDLLRRPDVFARGGAVLDRYRQMFGNGLGVSEGEFHRRQRAVLQPAFHRTRVVGYAAEFSRLTTEKIGGWPDGGRLRVDREMDELALAVATRVIFATDAPLDGARFMAAATVFLGGLFRRITDVTGLVTSLPTARNRRYREATEYLRRTIDEVITAYREGGADHGDLLSMMLLARDEDGLPAMTDEQVHDEVMTFYIAGSNTVSNTLSWAFHEIAEQPEVERRLHAEVDRVLAGRPAGYAELAELEYSRRIISETLRKRTQGLFLSRVTTAATELGGYAIPAGVSVLYSFHALNHNPAIHAEPERFDPDRWSPERAGAAQRTAFLPFGAGVHGCIGEHFAWAEMTAILATVAARYRLVGVPGAEPHPVPAITMPVDALPMTAHRR
jgi:pentalenene oxygenase